MVFLQLDRNKILARAVDVMMALAKIINFLIMKVNKLLSCFSLLCFLEEVKNMFSVSPLSSRDTSESLRELEKAVETACLWLVYPQHFSFSQTSTRVSITR